MRTIKIYLYGLLVLIFAIFVIQNYSTLTYSVSLKLNLWVVSLESVPLPFFLIAPLIFFCGLLLATLISWGERHRLSKELKSTKNALREAEQKQESKMETSPGSVVADEAESLHSGNNIPNPS